MAIEAQRDNIARIENPRFVALDLNDVVNVQRGIFPDVLAESAVGAGEVVALENGESEFGVSLVAAFASLLGSELCGECRKIEINSKPVRALLGVEVPMSKSASTLSTDSRSRFLGQPTVPRGFPELNLAAIGMVASLELGNSKTAAALVHGKGIESLPAAARADDFDSGSLKFGSAHVVPSYHRQVN
jgi:hypothetical protein